MNKLDLTNNEENGKSGAFYPLMFAVYINQVWLEILSSVIGKWWANPGKASLHNTQDSKDDESAIESTTLQAVSPATCECTVLL